MNSVVDTNVVLYHLAGNLLHPLPSGTLYVSIITEIELLAFKPLTVSEKHQIQAFLRGVTVVDLNSSIKAATIQMRISGLRLPDAVIAATALVYSAELLTHDTKLLKTPGIVARAPDLK